MFTSRNVDQLKSCRVVVGKVQMNACSEHVISELSVLRIKIIVLFDFSQILYKTKSIF
jgi:hypothetical protein